MLSWFNATEFTRFGEELALQFMEDKPGVLEGNRKYRRMRKKKDKGMASDPLEATLQKLVTRISAFEPRKGANFYKKAKFANAFKWKLLDAGYDAGFVDSLTKELVVHLR